MSDGIDSATLADIAEAASNLARRIEAAIVVKKPRLGIAHDDGLVYLRYGEEMISFPLGEWVGLLDGEVPERTRPSRPRPGDRGLNGDEMGTYVSCGMCSGSGLLHDPDCPPPVVEPTPDATSGRVAPPSDNAYARLGLMVRT